jgi:transposase InsO family protein
VIYKKGVENGVADALSRRPSDNLDCYHISSSTPVWLSKVIAGYEADPHTQQLIAELTLHQAPDSPFQLKAGLLRYKGRIWVGANPSLQLKIVSTMHDSAIGGHSGFLVTYRRVHQLFAWPKMKSYIKEYVAACSICQQSKPDRAKYPGLLQALPIPDQAWQVISMDFIEALPKSNGADCILVVVDKFFKYGHFIPLAHPYTASKVAHLFMSTVYRLHGLPEAIISDRDRVFTSTFWKELFTMAGTQLRMSSAYHPQSDGQTECVNQCLETFLRCFVHTCPSKWHQWLHLAEFWYNTCFHSALGRSPFEVLYGRTPRQLGIKPVDSIANSDLSTWLSQRELMSRVVHQHLLRARNRMKQQADKTCSDCEFAEGDYVYLKLQPYIQSSIAPRSNHKLQFKYFGPFQILQRIGKVAYKLDLPSSTAIHPVIHVSQLKSAITSKHQVSTTLPSTSVHLQIPTKVLATRTITRGGSPVEQVQVQWSGFDDALATWEDATALHQQFP